MNLISALIGIVALVAALVGFIPFLGWLNWLVISVAAIGTCVRPILRQDDWQKHKLGGFGDRHVSALYRRWDLI